MRGTRRLAPGLLIALVLTGCSMWSQGRADGGHSGSNPFEDRVTVATVGGLAPSSFILAPQPTTPSVNSAGLAAFTTRSATRELRTYDLTHCGPASCRRISTATGTSGLATSPAFVGDAVFASTQFGIAAFDAHATQSCSAAPAVCSPRWIAVPPDFGNPTGSITDYAVDGDQLVAHIVVNDDGDELFVAAYDAHGVQGCSVAPPLAPTCEPLWLQFVGAPDSQQSGIDAFRPVVSAGGHIVSLRAHTLFSGLQTRSAAGAPVWDANGDFDGDVVATANRTWVPLATGAVAAFDTRGVTGCVTVPTTFPRKCSPLWTTAAPAPIVGTAVANGFLYATATDGHLYVFDARGDDGCTGVPKVCAPLWSAPVDAATALFAPTVAGRVVYVATAEGALLAFDSAGVVDCTGEPKVCAPLKSVPLASPAIGPPVVAAGRVLVPSTDRITVLTVPA